MAFEYKHFLNGILKSKKKKKKEKTEVQKITIIYPFKSILKEEKD